MPNAKKTETSYFLHIIPTEIAGTIKKTKYYKPESFDVEGFVHLCSHQQVHSVVNELGLDVNNISLLIILEQLLENDVIFEKPKQSDSSTLSQELFPHYYHPVNVDSVIDIVDYNSYKESPIDEAVITILERERFNRLPVEGTLYRNTWLNKINEDTPLGTAMIGLFTQQPESVSRFHKLTYDEVWHFYAGSPIELFLIYPDGREQRVVLSNSLKENEYVQFVVPKGVWQAGRVIAGGNYALYGCTMAPGFHVECFEAATLDELSHLYPNSKAILLDLAVKSDDIHMEALPDGHS